MILSFKMFNVNEIYSLFLKRFGNFVQIYLQIKLITNLIGVVDYYSKMQPN